MCNVILKNFKEIILADDIKYFKFEEEKSNKLYLIEDSDDKVLEEKVENLLKCNNINEVLEYFNKTDVDANIFEFVNVLDLKDYKDTIKQMTEIEKQKLTEIIKESRDLKVKYINFTYFFFETEDEKLYFVKELKNGSLKIKNLKIERTIIQVDISVVMRDIKAYGAFKFRNKTIKYEDIKCYIDNPLLSVEEELKWVIDKIRAEEEKKKIDVITSEKEEIKSVKEPEEKKVLEENKDVEKPKKEKKKKKKNKENKSSKDNLFIYCLIGFTIGVILAAITIIVGNYI